jgi:AAHS family 4-hydroxybenzoate transporter-like MFS transporter
VHLFRNGRAAATILLWIVNFMNLINLFFLSSWLPTVVRSAGYPTRVAVLVGTTLQVGGTIGTFGLAWLIERRGFIPVLGGSFLLACLAVAFIGQPALTLTMLFIVVFVAGWCVVGGQPGVNALAATYYPTYLRSTGIGWGLGIGRIGAIVGPVVAGQLIGLKWSSQQLFYAAAVPALISALVMFSLRWVIKPEATTSAKDAVLVH